MVDFTESMFGIASPSVGAATVPSAGFTTMLNVVLGASGLSAHAVPASGHEAGREGECWMQRRWCGRIVRSSSRASSG